MQNQDGLMHVSTMNVQLHLNDGLHIGSDEYMANRLMESPSVASSDSMSETTDLEDNVVAPETTTTGNTISAGKKQRK
jgi:hypothetical protein